MTPQEIEKKVEARAAELMDENTLPAMRSLYQKTMNIATKSKNKAWLAAKIAAKEVGSNGASSSTSPPSGSTGLTEDEMAKLAKSTVTKIRSAWDHLERLSEERKSKLAKLREQLNGSRDALAQVVKDDTLPDSTKITKIEGHWTTITRTEQKMAEVRETYKDRISDARQTLRTEFDNSRQLSLFD